MILLIAAAVWNIKSYFVRKSEIEPYIATFSYLIRVLRAAEALGKEKIPEIQFYLDKLHKLREEMNVFLKHSHVLVAGRGATGSMVDAVLDYIRMLFHIDLIKFNSMLEMAEKNRGKIEEVIQIIGYLDSMISAASFRTFLPYYEKPNFTERKEGRNLSGKCISSTAGRSGGKFCYSAPKYSSDWIQCIWKIYFLKDRGNQYGAGADDFYLPGGKI